MINVLPCSPFRVLLLFKRVVSKKVIMMVRKNREYDGWLVSDNIIKRAFGVLLHMILAELILLPIVFVFFFMVGLIISFGLAV